MKQLIILLLLINMSVFGQDTIYFTDYEYADHFSDSINTPNGYPRQNTIMFQLPLYDSLNNMYYHIINKVSEKGLSESDSLWVEMMYVDIDELCWYNSIRYRVIQSHYTTTGWEPDIVPALFVVDMEGCNEWVQPAGGHDAYNIGDCVLFSGLEYISLIDANVWSPAVYPAGWELK